MSASKKDISFTVIDLVQSSCGVRAVPRELVLPYTSYNIPCGPSHGNYSLFCLHNFTDHDTGLLFMDRRADRPIGLALKDKVPNPVHQASGGFWI